MCVLNKLETVDEIGPLARLGMSRSGRTLQSGGAKGEKLSFSGEQDDYQVGRGRARIGAFLAATNLWNQSTNWEATSIKERERGSSFERGSVSVVCTGILIVGGKKCFAARIFRPGGPRGTLRCLSCKRNGETMIKNPSPIQR